MPNGETADDFWEGIPRGNATRYITDLLVDPANVIIVQQPLPADSTLFGPYAGSTHPYASLVCYPTTTANPHADYPLPSGKLVPHMQRGAQAPVFASEGTRYPVLLFSHGLTGSPISGEYIDVIKLFASHGYVVLAPFHGDARFAHVDLEGFEDVVYALLNFKKFVAMQAVRPLSLSTALDALLSHPHFRDHVDADRVGGFGASLGAESLMLMGGAALTTSVGQSSQRVILDPRVKAAVGYVPYFGIEVYPAFGRDQKGLDGVTLPYLALSGTADTTAPFAATEKGIERLTGTRQLVALTDVVHGFATAFTEDIFTWSLTFLAGQLSGDPVRRATSARMTAVEGGGDDVLRIDYMTPAPSGDGERIAVEYFNDALGHFFFTAEPDEAAMLDAGAVVPGWRRTTFDFKVRPAGSVLGLDACRFFGTPPIGPNSHFFTIDAAECASVRNNPLWTYEGLAFNADLPTSGDCAADRIPVIRLYNDGMGGQANHRYLTSKSEVRATHGAGWIVEGPVFCAVP